MAIQNLQASDEDLQFFQQLGIEWIMLGVEDPALQTVEHYRRFVERFAAYGIQIYRISNRAVHNVPEITLNLPGRDEKIEEFCQFIRNIGAAGVRYHTYAHMGNGIWSSGRTTRRGSMSARTLDIKNATGHWGAETYEGELTHDREYSEGGGASGGA